MSTFDSSMSVALALALIEDWDFFVTLTYAGRVPTRSVAMGQWHGYLRRLRGLGIRLDRVSWALREELGDKHGRYHHHALFSQTDLALNRGNAHRIKWHWNRFAGSIAVVQVYDRKRHGAEYIAKNGFDLREAMGYERSKFASCTFLDGSIHFSATLMARLAGLVRHRDRRTAQALARSEGQGMARIEPLNQRARHRNEGVLVVQPSGQGASNGRSLAGSSEKAA